MFLSMFLRIGVWRNLWRAYRRGFRGNLRGEGLVLGGVFVIGPGQQVRTNLNITFFYSHKSKLLFIYLFFTCVISSRAFYWSTVRRSLGIK